MQTWHDPSVQLRRRLTDLEAPLDGVSRDALRATVRDYVDEAKHLGWPPERVIVAVKRVAHDAGLRPSARVVLTMPTRGVTAKDELLVEMVKWCIDRYYEP